MALFVFNGCSNGDQQKARHFFDKAQLLYTQQHYNQAKSTLDSISLLFPQLISMRQKADTLMYRIRLQEAVRNLSYADSLLKIKQHAVDSLARSFSFEKNTKYDEMGQYTYKTLLAASYATRSYLKPIVAENGVITLMSIYCGPPIHHRQVKASVNDVFVNTHVANEGSCFSYTNQGRSWENVSFTGKEINGVLQFIANNLHVPVTVTLIGDKKNYLYIIDQANKEAIVQSYYLGEALKELQQQKLNIRFAKETIIINCGHLHLNPQLFLPNDHSS
ncbi:MAG: hypothetical protein ACP5F6_08930 [Microbacter sp.]